jgi:hypothetical protein
LSAYPDESIGVSGAFLFGKRCFVEELKSLHQKETA